MIEWLIVMEQVAHCYGSGSYFLDWVAYCYGMVWIIACGFVAHWYAKTWLIVWFDIVHWYGIEWFFCDGVAQRYGIEWLIICNGVAHRILYSRMLWLIVYGCVDRRMRWMSSFQWDGVVHCPGMFVFLNQNYQHHAFLHNERYCSSLWLHSVVP